MEVFELLLHSLVVEKPKAQSEHRSIWAAVSSPGLRHVLLKSKSNTPEKAPPLLLQATANGTLKQALQAKSDYTGGEGDV